MSGANGSQIVLLGSPGAGKGTQAALLSKRLRVPHISTGEILRREVARGSELGSKAREIMERGELVPDDLMLGIIRGRLAEDDCRRGFILDGFPRSVPQAVRFEQICSTGNGLRALSLNVPTEEVIRRLAGRRTCGRCGAMYNLAFHPPAKSGTCDKCGGELYQRDDDGEEIIHARLDVYHRETEPLLAFYRQRNALLEVDGTGTSSDVFERILERLGIPR